MSCVDKHEQCACMVRLKWLSMINVCKADVEVKVLLNKVKGTLHYIPLSMSNYVSVDPGKVTNLNDSFIY